VVEHPIDATYLRKAESTTVGTVDALTHGVRLIFDSLPVADSSSPQSATILTNLIQRREKVLVDSDDVVLTTHISPNKLEVLLIQLKFWGGPASVTVYIKDQTGINQFFKSGNNITISSNKPAFTLFFKRPPRYYIPTICYVTWQ
jgi:hypothetical protein